LDNPLNFKNFIYVLNILLAVLSLGILASYFWGGANVGFFGVLQLMTLPILIGHTLFFLYWVFKSPKFALLSLAVLGISYFSFGDFLKIGQDALVKDGSFKVMSYNVMGFNRYDHIKIPNAGDSISAFIKRINPDILCLQEHSRIRYRQLEQYPYRSETPYNTKRTVQAIFSKYPIVGKGSLDLPQSANNIIFADITIGSDTIRVYNVHLESFKIVPRDTDISSKESERVYQRIKTTIALQRQQTQLLRKHIAKSPYKVLVCGDFNNTQFSRVFRLISEEMEDSFQTRGSGMGVTYNIWGLPLRIDYILADENYEFLAHFNYENKYSDHEPIMAKMVLKSNK